MSVVERAAPGPRLTLAPPARVASLAASGWARGIAGLILLIWLIPTQKYTLPVQLPFNLEPYRIFILVLVGALAVAKMTGTTRLSAAGHSKPLVLLAVAALAAQVSNWTLITSAGAQTEALKSLSYFLSFMVAFVIVCSTLRSTRDIDVVLKAIVAGASVVALAALYESRFRTNLFDSLDSWLPFLQEYHEDRSVFRGGRLRVRASAHHPIALAGALTMCIPLAIYLARQASTKARSVAWVVTALTIAAGASATVSRTVVLMLAVMLAIGLWLRGRALLRKWPLVIVLIAFVHFTAPATMGQLYSSLTPREGLIGEQQGRAGLSGSGRVADVDPALDRWLEKPIIGHGLGLGGTTGELRGALQPRGDSRSKTIIYDNQYLQILVSLGIVGFVGSLWFVWGAVAKLARSARRTLGPDSDRLTALAIASAGYGAGMLTYDAFSFVQVTLLFFVIAALGLRARVVREA